MVSKSHILAEIKRTAAENAGRPLGTARFEQATGIKQSDWAGKHWARWGDALIEAGFEPNQMRVAYDERWLVEQLAIFIKQIGHYPVRRELQMRARRDASFPSANVFEKRGRKPELAAKIIELFADRSDLSDAVAICRPLVESETDEGDIEGDDGNGGFGWVYLVKSGKFYKLGRSNSAGRREYELAIKMPEELTTVHAIKTDDAVGIEEYWHKRFADKRKGGEWFDLTAADVRAFKRRKFM